MTSENTTASDNENPTVPSAADLEQAVPTNPEPAERVDHGHLSPDGDETVPDEQIPEIDADTEDQNGTPVENPSG